MPSNMHSNNRLKFGSFTLKTLSAAVASALLFSNAHAAGLGKLTVLSSLGQPLRAEIELTAVSRDEAGALVAKLASADAFRQANVEFSGALTSLRFAIEQRSDRQFIRVTSASPLNEPFVDMLLELAGPNGRLVREYTFLLDPPDLRTTQSAQVAPANVPEAKAPGVAAPAATMPAPQAASPERPAPNRRAAPAPAAPRVAKPATSPAEAPANANADASSGEYRVRNGDSLARIAIQMKSSGISLDQMLVALYQANPDAFINQNMNRLKAGRILSVPSADAARSVSNAEAHGIVLAQSADFNNYRSKLAGQVAAGAAQKSGETTQSASGKITAKVEEKTSPANEAKDKLKLSNSIAAPGADKAAGGQTAEDRIAKEKAVAEANARVKELEKNVNDLQKVLEVKNKNLAEQQKQADAANATKSTVPPVAASAPAAPAVSAAPAAPAPAASASAPAASASAPAASTPVKPAETADKPADKPAADAPAKSKPKVVVPPPETSLVDDVMSNPMTLPGLGALLVALAGFGVYSASRKKRGKQFEDSIITDSSLKANSLFGSTGGQSVDTNNSVFNSSFSPSASQLDSNEVDPVAEADVYIAYGRDAQAEEILKEALRTQPERNAVRLKLLEIYSNRKDLRAFEVLASELYGLTKGEGDDWKQAAALGIAIDPENPLYASGDMGAHTMPPVMVAPTQPLDEQGLATLLTTHSDTPAEDNKDMDIDATHFNNAAPMIDTPLATPPDAAPGGNADETPSSNDLDFDLEGMSFQETGASSATAEPTPVQPTSDLTSIDFDFLDDPKSADPVSQPVAEPESMFDLSLDSAPMAEPVVEPAAEPDAISIPPIEEIDMMPVIDTPAAEAMPEPAVDDAAAFEINIPGLPEQTAQPEANAESTADPLDFDLSSISLELNPGEPEAKSQSVSEFASVPDLMGDSKPAMNIVDLPPLGDEASSMDAEMATKLDLAIAYQEIGDKEGARELLDEVLKGGSPEQTEKAKSLLLELA
jgi:pilus assembly protein FimV